MMSKFTDPAYLKKEQYRDSSNLDARVNLHQRFSTNPQGWFNWVFDTLEQLPAQARVLELGCGPAYLWSECKQRIPPGWSITLSDLSDGMLLDAWRNVVVTGRAFKHQQIDAQSIPYPDETFEIVIANHMLYHVPQRDKALREIHRVLKPSGHLVAATVGKGHLEELNVWLKQVSREHDFAPFSNPFTLESGLSELAEVFAGVEVRQYQDSLSITEIEPLVAYIRSTLSAADLSELELVELRRSLEIRLNAEKALTVAKNSGLFLAVK